MDNKIDKENSINKNKDSKYEDPKCVKPPEVLIPYATQKAAEINKQSSSNKRHVINQSSRIR